MKQFFVKQLRDLNNHLDRTIHYLEDVDMSLAKPSDLYSLINLVHSFRDLDGSLFFYASLSCGIDPSFSDDFDPDNYSQARCIHQEMMAKRNKISYAAYTELEKRGLDETFVFS